MNSERMLMVLSIECLGSGQQGERRINSFDNMLLRIRILKKGHETVTGYTANIAAGLANKIEKSREIMLYQHIELFHGQFLTQASVAADIDEEDRNVLLALFD